MHMHVHVHVHAYGACARMCTLHVCACTHEVGARCNFATHGHAVLVGGPPASYSTAIALTTHTANALHLYRTCSSAGRADRISVTVRYGGIEADPYPFPVRSS